MFVRGCRILAEGWSDLRSKKVLKHILGSWLVKNFDGQPRVVLVVAGQERGGSRLHQVHRM